MRKAVVVLVGTFVVGAVLASSCGSDEPTTQSTGTGGSGTAGKAGGGAAGVGVAGSGTGGAGAAGTAGTPATGGGGAAGAGGGDASAGGAGKMDASADTSVTDASASDVIIPEGSVFSDAPLFEDADLGDAEPPPEEAGADGGALKIVPCSAPPAQGLRCNLATDACCWDSNAAAGQCSATAAACPGGYGKLQCDGPEDCPGQICCARRSRLIIIFGDGTTSTPEYSSTCADTCTGNVIVSAVTLCKRTLIPLGNNCPKVDGGNQLCDPLSGLPNGFRGCHL